MQKIWLILLCAGLFCVQSYAEPQKLTQETGQPDYAKLIPPGKLKEDLDFLFKTIEEVHPNMYAYTSKEEFALIRQQLYKDINQPMKQVEFFKLVSPVIAKLKNGHMNLGFPDEFEAYTASGGKVFPLKFYWDGDKAILSENRGHDVLPMGGIVEAINNQEVGMLLQRLGKYRADECKNNDEFFAGIYLHRYLWLEYGNADLWKLRVKDINGKTSNYVVRGIPWEEYSANNPHKPDFAYKYLKEYNAGIVRFKSCSHLEKFKSFLKEAFQEIKEREVSNLIIDIRYNVGGESTLVYALLEYITDKPFRMGDKCNTKISRQMYGDDLENVKKELRDKRIEIGSIVSMEESLVQPNDNPLRFKGKCYLLIDRLVFSSGCQFASVVKCFNIATVIGEETWGTTAAYGAIREHISPNSGLKFYVPSKYIVQACGKPDGRGVIPDYEVKQKPEDTAKGVDTVLQFTLNLIEKEQLKQVEKQIAVRDYFLFYCSSDHGRNLRELHNPANNPILNACLTGATYEDLEGLGIKDLAGRLQTLKDGQIIEEVNGRYYMAFPVVLGAKRENLQKLAEHTALQLLPVTEKIMETIEVQLNGRKEMLFHILWSIVMDGSVSWNVVQTELDERVKKGDTKIQNTPWIIYPKHPCKYGTNWFGNPDSQVMLVSITSGFGATTIYKKIEKYQNQLIQSHNTSRPIENTDARKTLARYGFVDDKGIAKAYIINIDSETAWTYKKLGSEFGCEVIEHLDIEKIANQLDVSPGQALVITYHEVCYEILKQLISKELLEVPAKKEDQIYRLVSFVTKREEMK